MHVEVDPDMTVSCSHRIGHEVKDKIRAEIPAVYDVLVHIEPRRAPSHGTGADDAANNPAQGGNTTR